MIVPVYVRFENIDSFYSNITSIFDLYFLSDTFYTDVCVNFSTQYILDKHNLEMFVINNTYNLKAFNQPSKFTKDNFKTYLEHIKTEGCEKVFERLVEKWSLDVSNSSDKNILIACFDIDEFNYLNSNFETLNICICLDDITNYKTELFDFSIDYTDSVRCQHSMLFDFLKLNLN